MRQHRAEYAGALSLIALGVALGPSGLGVLTPQLLELVDPAIPVALAALGVLAGLGSGPLKRIALRRSARAVIYDLAAAAAVGGGTFLLSRALGVAGAPASTTAAVVGICFVAARSNGDVVPILLGALLLAWLRDGASMGAWFVANAAVVAATCAVTGWLMLYRTSSDGEPRGVMVAMLLLIGGAADYLSVSALIAGLVAGLCWRLIGGVTGESARREAGSLRHPLLAVLLLTSGALADVTAVPIALGLGYAAIAALLPRLGEALATTVADGSNMLAVALALTAVRVAGSEMALPLGIVVVGTLLSQLLIMARGQAATVE